ncbi:hypothetical protein VP01_2463g2 [Puccinia sorghi]|uniref:Uncharacterized protein n=1 Tax=Puccinia sorghi TaxID=27349 RepID=A0A0L6V602_9BASI|nr:hypothetical protein VP01_2463g2 [Puccinia sorghi]
MPSHLRNGRHLSAKQIQAKPQVEAEIQAPAHRNSSQEEQRQDQDGLGEQLPAPLHPSTVGGTQDASNTQEGERRTLAPNPQGTTPHMNREESMDVENSPLDTVLNVFQGQWLMWMNARNAQNAQMMRMALTQAISSQELIIEMGGQREMIRICDNWDAREELRHLDYLPHLSTNLPRRLAINHNTYRTLAV